MSRPVLIAPALLATTPAAAIALSIFGAFRLSGETIGFFEAWLAVAGLFCPLLALLVASARVVRRTMRTYAPSAGVPLVVGAALWALAALPATAVLGAMLKANTHHRALAGATFAALALVVQVGSALVAWRMTSLVLPRVRRASTRATVTLILGAAALVLFVVRGLGRRRRSSRELGGPCSRAARRRRPRPRRGGVRRVRRRAERSLARSALDGRWGARVHRLGRGCARLAQSFDRPRRAFARTARRHGRRPDRAFSRSLSSRPREIVRRIASERARLRSCHLTGPRR